MLDVVGQLNDLSTARRQLAEVYVLSNNEVLHYDGVSRSRFSRQRNDT